MCCQFVTATCPAWRLMPAARPISVQEAPAAFAAATVLSRRCPACRCSLAAASTPGIASGLSWLTGSGLAERQAADLW